MLLKADTSALTVTEYASRIGQAVRHVGGAVVEGEVQRPHTSRGGLLYFDLTDGDSKLCCKVFGRQVHRLRHTPAEGDLVQVTVERPDFWSVAGKLDLIVAEVELAGVGELLRRRAELLGRLKAEGLCDPDAWKPIPLFPRAVGLIAGRGSDGRSDVIRALQDRYPPVHIVTCDALVQGKRAPRDVIDALIHLQEHPLVEVIIVARGGGSVQDLIAFDDEGLCRALHACDVPVVTAIGHTDNTPVCNHVTHAAYTPSRSAEIVVPSVAELRQEIMFARQAIEALPSRVERRVEQLDALRDRLRVPDLLDRRARTVIDLGARIEQAKEAFFATRESGLVEARAVVETIPHRARFAIASREQQLVAERPRLSAARERVAAVSEEIARHGREIGTAVRRQLADHERDYAHALARLLRETKNAALRRIGAERERTDQAATVVSERVARRLHDAERDLKHVSALIEARDFRRAGYVLATGEDGRPVPSVAGLRRGARLNLNFRDGRARTVVNDIEEEVQ